MQLARNIKPGELQDLIDLLTKTHTAVTQRTAVNVTALAQQGQKIGQCAKWKLLGGAAIVLGGLVLMAAFMATAVISLGVFSPVSIVGITAAFTLVTAGVAVGLGGSATRLGVGLGYGSFFKKEWQKNEVQQSAVAISNLLLSPSSD